MHATGAVRLGDTQTGGTHVVSEQPSDLPAGLPGRVQGPLDPLLHLLHLLSVHSQLRSTHRLMLLGPQHSFSSSNTQHDTWYMQQVGSVTATDCAIVMFAENRDSKRIVLWTPPQCTPLFQNSSENTGLLCCTAWYACTYNQLADLTNADSTYVHMSHA